MLRMMPGVEIVGASAASQCYLTAYLVVSLLPWESQLLFRDDDYFA